MKKYTILSLFACAALSAEYNSAKVIELMEDIVDAQLLAFELNHSMSLEESDHREIVVPGSKIFEKICEKISQEAVQLTDADKARIRQEWSQIALTPENHANVRIWYKNGCQKNFLKLNFLYASMQSEKRSLDINVLQEIYKELIIIFRENPGCAHIILKTIADEGSSSENGYNIFNEFEHMMYEFEIPSEVLMDAFLNDTSGKIMAWFIINSYKAKEAIAKLHIYS